MPRLLNVGESQRRLEFRNPPLKIAASQARFLNTAVQRWHTVDAAERSPEADVAALDLGGELVDLLAVEMPGAALVLLGVEQDAFETADGCEALAESASDLPTGHETRLARACPCMVLCA